MTEPKLRWLLTCSWRLEADSSAWSATASAWVHARRLGPRHRAHHHDRGAARWRLSRRAAHAGI